MIKLISVVDSLKINKLLLKEKWYKVLLIKELLQMTSENFFSFNEEKKKNYWNIFFIIWW